MQNCIGAHFRPFADERCSQPVLAFTLRPPHIEEGSGQTSADSCVRRAGLAKPLQTRAVRPHIKEGSNQTCTDKHAQAMCKGRVWGRALRQGLARKAH